MKIISRLLYALVIIAGIVLASMNMQVVTVTYLPELSISPIPEGAAFDFPLALLLLAVLVIGVLIAGLGAFVEHVRLRAGLRKQSKLNARLEQELVAARAALGDAATAAQRVEDTPAAETDSATEQSSSEPAVSS